MLPAMDQRDDRPTPPGGSDILVAGLLGLVALAVYLKTLTPSLSYQSPDGNELATIPAVLGLAHPPGYPLYTWLGKLFSLLPLGDVALRMNLLSAVSAGLAVAGLYLICLWLLPLERRGRRPAAALACLLAAFGPTFWSQAVITEVYAPNLAGLAGTLLLLLRWEHSRRDRDFFLFSLAFGLSLGLHLSSLGFAPAYAQFILLTDWRSIGRPTWWLAGLAGFGLGASQYLWVAYRLDTFEPSLLLGRTQAGLAGLYSYTLGSFSELKFAIPLLAVPERVAGYLTILRQELGAPALIVGVIGQAALLLRRPRHYHLLVWMYLVQLWFFLQYRAFDLEVFYLPAHWLWSVFVAFGACQSLGLLYGLLCRIGRASAWVRLSPAGLSGLLLASAAVPLLSHWRVADRSQDVSVSDFYANVWEILPAQAALLTPGGVFGYDALYWRLIYGTRPDVLLPTTPSPMQHPGDLQGRSLFSTTPQTAGDQPRSRWAPSADLLPPAAWSVPVLVGASDSTVTSAALGSRSRLTLYALSAEPPLLVIDEAAPARRLDLPLGRLTFVGADVPDAPVESGGRVSLTLYWESAADQAAAVSVGLDGHDLETHELGFGNLDRYRAEIGPTRGRIIVERYWLVIPSTIAAGVHSLTVRVGVSGQPVEFAPLTVIDEEGRLEHWLSAAG